MAWSWIVFGVLGVLGMVLPAQAGQLTYWRFNHEQQRLDLTTKGEVQPKAMLLANPARLVIDLPDTNLGQQLPREQKGKKRIREIRAGQFTPQTTRIVIELKRKYGLVASEIRVRGLTTDRWFIQLPEPVRIARGEAQPGDTRTEIAIAVPPPPEAPRISLPPPPQPRVQKPLPPAAAKPQQRLPPRKLGPTVVIDPGHGGPDPGAVGINGIQEKRIVLAISQQVAARLRARGLNAVLTRRDDRDLNLAPRVAIAEQVQAKIFVSIHANAISLSRPEVNGLETYYYRTGSGLARTVHRQILRQVNVRDRGVRQARFYVLRHTSMPATLVEVGFVTGREDAPRLATAAYQQQLAQAIADGILQYLKIKP